MSQLIEQQIDKMPAPLTPLQEFWHYFSRNKGRLRAWGILSSWSLLLYWLTSLRLMPLMNNFANFIDTTGLAGRRQLAIYFRD